MTCQRIHLESIHCLSATPSSDHCEQWRHTKPLLPIFPLHSLDSEKTILKLLTSKINCSETWICPQHVSDCSYSFIFNLIPLTSEKTILKLLTPKINCCESWICLQHVSNCSCSFIFNVILFWLSNRKKLLCNWRTLMSGERSWNTFGISSRVNFWSNNVKLNSTLYLEASIPTNHCSLLREKETLFFVPFKIWSQGSFLCYFLSLARAS